MNINEITKIAIEEIAEIGSKQTTDAKTNFNLQGHACAIVMFAQKLGVDYKPLSAEFDKWFH